MLSSPFGARTTCDEVVAGLDLHGRTMLVTGCSAGIGFETARALAARGAHVLLGCRSPDSAAATAARIRARHAEAQLTPLVVDLASFASVREAAARLHGTPLDALICNAGVLSRRYATTADGLERTVGVCHFGHFLLVSSLLNELRAAAPARVVMVSSESHRYPATLSFDRFPLPRERYSTVAAYGQAKLCNVLFANELTRRYEREGVTANALHPGTLMATSLAREAGAAALLMRLIKPFTKTLAQGAATTVYCATAPALEGIGGRYFLDCQEKTPSRGARDDAAARRLWELSVQTVMRSEQPPARPSDSA